VSIVRSELAQRLTRWREVIVWGAVLAVGLALVVRGLSPGAVRRTLFPASGCRAR
jgi:hypothetical protein